MDKEETPIWLKLVAFVAVLVIVTIIVAFLAPSVKHNADQAISCDAYKNSPLQDVPVRCLKFYTGQ